MDTGAAVSILPRDFPGRPVSGPVPALTAANGTAMACYGMLQASVVFGGLVHSQVFAVADTKHGILGFDFVRAHGMTVQSESVTFSCNCRPPPRRGVALMPRKSSLSVPVPKLSSVNKISAAVDSLKQEFKDIFSNTYSPVKPAHGVQHTIVTSGPPVRMKPRRLDPERLEIAKRYFQDLIDQGICKRANLAWASPLHMVRKADMSWRPCGDYRVLNSQTRKDTYTLPNIRDFSANLIGKKLFTTLDLVKGYYQIPMAPEDIDKTAVVTPFGTFVFLVMPFGLMNAGSTFQRCLDQILGGIPHVYCYLDDILISSSTFQEHLVHVREVLLLLRKNGLCINPNKSCFFQESVTYLGHKISSSGMVPLSKNLDAIAQFGRPKDKPALLRFLGLINYYRVFVKDAASILRPLTKLTSPKIPWEWSTECEDAFNKAKQQFLSAAALAFPDPSAPLRLTTDASDIGVGATLEQFRGGLWEPLGFFSRHLTQAQIKYSAFDKELYAAFAAIKHFRHSLECARFQLRTDHKPLQMALRRVGDPWSPRQCRQLAWISEFTEDVVYLPGPKNVVADALS